MSQNLERVTSPVSFIYDTNYHRIIDNEVTDATCYEVVHLMHGRLRLVRPVMEGHGLTSEPQIPVIP